jgi:hypothetical protein
VNIDKAIRRIRNSGVLFDVNEAYADKASRILGLLLTARAKRHKQGLEPVGPYSGLTKRELAASGTCETDWY